MTQASEFAAELRTPRAAAVAGIAFSVLLSMVVVLLRSAVPGDPGDAAAWLLGSAPHRVALALNLVPFAGIAFLWFIGVVRTRLGVLEDRLFATVFLGSGLLFVACLFAGAALLGSLMTTEDVSGSVGSPTWQFGLRACAALLSVYAMRMAAVFTLAVTTIGVRVGVIPRWLATLGYLAAVVLLLTSGWIPFVELLFPSWVFLLSLHILVTGSRPVGLSPRPTQTRGESE